MSIFQLERLFDTALDAIEADAKSHAKDVSTAAAYKLAPCSMVVFQAEVPKDPETNITR